MDTKNVILKGLLIFGILGFALFIILTVAGILLNFAGVGCLCYKIFAQALIVVGVVTFFTVWFGCCYKTESRDGS